MNIKDNLLESVEHLSGAIRNLCIKSVGPMSSNFLCASVSVLNPNEPKVHKESSTVQQIMTYLKDNRTGCAVIVNESGQLSGIFSERDYVLKLHGKADIENLLIKDFMTKNPTTISLDDTVAFALTLMSQGGFRHLPVVDSSKMPIGLLTVKDIVDHLSKEMMNELLTFDKE